jgi:hypothetical protein
MLEDMQVEGRTICCYLMRYIQLFTLSLKRYYPASPYISCCCCCCCCCSRFTAPCLCRSSSEQLASAILDLLAAALPDSPGNAAALQELGGTALLLGLLRQPSSSPALGLGAIQVRRVVAGCASVQYLCGVTACSTALLLGLLRPPSSSPGLGLGAIQVRRVVLIFSYTQCAV